MLYSLMLITRTEYARLFLRRPSVLRQRLPPAGSFLDLMELGPADLTLSPILSRPGLRGAPRPSVTLFLQRKERHIPLSSHGVWK